MEFLIYLAKFFLFTLLAEQLRPKVAPNRPAAAGLKDISFPTADPTRPHQWLFGTRIIDNANLFGTFDFREEVRTRSVRTGFISHQDMPLPSVYYISACMVLCGGTGVRLREVWLDDVMLWAGNVGNGGMVDIDHMKDEGNDQWSGFSGRVEFHSGSTTPSAYLEAKRGVGNVPSYRHLTYVVLRSPGGDGGFWMGTDKIVKPLKFVCERMPTTASTSIDRPPGYYPSGHPEYWQINGDANPAYAVAEVLLNKDYGAGMGAEQLDPLSFYTAAETLYNEGHGTSQLWDSQRATGDVVLELCRQMGGILQPDPLTGLQKLRLLRASDEIVFNLNDDNIKTLSQFSRSAMDEATNALALQYTDKADKWTQKPIEVQDAAAVEVSGQVISGTASYAGITAAELANTIAIRDLRAMSAPLAIARVTAIVTQSTKFLPGDAVQFSSVRNGIASFRMRVTSASYSNPGEALCELELVEDVFMSGEAVFTTPGHTGPATTYTPAPDIVGWSVTNYVAPAPLTDSPSEIHIMYFAGAPDTHPERATGYRLAYFDDQTTRNSHTASWAGSTTKFASKVSPVGYLAIGATGTLAATCTAADAYTIQQNSGARCLGLCGNEFVSCTATASGTTATVTVLERGVYGTMGAAGLGATIYLLYGWEVDPRALPVTSSTSGPTFRKNSADYKLRAQTFGPGGRGPFDTVSPTTDAGLIANLDPISVPFWPYAPGNITVGGVLVPEVTSTVSGVPTDFPDCSGATSIAWTGRNNANGGLESYLNGHGWEAGTTVSAAIVYQEAANDSAPWVVLATDASATAGLTYSLTGLPTYEKLFRCGIVVSSVNNGTRAWFVAWRQT